MVKLPPNSRELKIRFLVRRKYPDLFDVEGVLSSPQFSAKAFAALKEQAEQYRKTLDTKPDAELDGQYALETAEEARAKSEREEAARPFNQPFARANVTYWAKMSYWTLDEGVALSLGREPKVAAQL